VTFGWLAFAEIPAIIMATIAMEIFGRKIVLFFLLLMGGISCISPIFLPESYRWLITVLAVFGRSNISAAFSLIYVYSVEIFPTVLRSSGLGMCSMCSRIGGILAPQLIELKIFGHFFSILISGVVSVMAGLLFVSETHLST
jgi:OCT family organic cation transporter-like MFS transporter 13